ncbi:MAG: hypothetical protein INF91_06135 [Alphaproteobacteria bacterium]|nr:hypothetical protein [Alphaproteobacteria bacterium]
MSERLLESLQAGLAAMFGSGLYAFLSEKPLADWIWPQGLNVALMTALTWFVYKTVRSRAKP